MPSYLKNQKLCQSENTKIDLLCNFYSNFNFVNIIWAQNSNVESQIIIL